MSAARLVWGWLTNAIAENTLLARVLSLKLPSEAWLGIDVWYTPKYTGQRNMYEQQVNQLHMQKGEDLAA